MNEEYMNELRELKGLLKDEDEKLVFFVGAGISKPSGLPDFEGLTKGIIDAISTGKNLKNEIWIRPEVLLLIMHDIIGDKAIDVLDILKSDIPTYEHFFLTKMAAIGHGNFIITTNLDTLIEQTYKEIEVCADDEEFEQWFKKRRKEKCIFKIHGTLDKRDTIIATLDQTRGELPRTKREVLKYFIKNYDMIFCGYSNRDYFDIKSVLSSTETEKKRFWICHTEKKDEFKVERKENSVKIFCDTKEFMKDLSDSLNLKDQNNWDLEYEWSGNGFFKEWATDIGPYNKNLIIAHIFEFLGEWNRAEKYCNKCLKETEEDADIAEIKWHLGETHYKKAEWDTAIDEYKESLKIFDRLGDEKTISRLNADIGLAYYKKGNLNDAERCYKRVMGLTNRETKEYADALNRLALIYYQRGTANDLEEALKKFDESIRVKEKLKDVRGIIESNNGKALTLYKQGKLDKAISLHEKNFQMRKDIGDLRGSGQTCYNLGLACAAIGDLPRAIKWYKRCRECYEKIQSPIQEISAVDYRIGELNLKECNFEEALKQFERVKEVMEGLGDWHRLVNTLNNLSKAHFKKGNLNESVECYKEILEIYEKRSDDEIRNRVYGCLNAKQNLSDALELFSEIKDSLNKNKALNALKRIEKICDVPT